MKTFVLICVVILGLVCARPDEKYTIKYDGIDLKEILNNERLLKNYYKCLMDEDPCNSDGEELKKILPDALQTECSKCSERQKEGARQVINFLIENKRDWWTALENKYDKEGIYRKKYDEIIKKENLKI